jgi:hypothetical protein
MNLKTLTTKGITDKYLCINEFTIHYKIYKNLPINEFGVNKFQKMKNTYKVTLKHLSTKWKHISVKNIKYDVNNPCKSMRAKPLDRLC